MGDSIQVEHVYDDSGPVGVITCSADVTREELERIVREYREWFGDKRAMVFRTRRVADPTLAAFHEPKEDGEA